MQVYLRIFSDPIISCDCSTTASQNGSYGHVPFSLSVGRKQEEKGEKKTHTHTHTHTRTHTTTTGEDKFIGIF
jgi:hypothetical protein